jgi:PPOX class probable F420-dependent enzyme
MTMPIPDSHRSLLEGRPTGVLTTVGPNGGPQTTAIWFLLEGDIVRTSVLETRQKLRNLQRDPKCSLFVFDPENLRKTIELRGQATLEPDPDRAFTYHIIRHYGMDPEKFPDDPSVARFVLTLEPARVVTFGS